MIDPKRQRANEQRAENLLAFQRQLTRRGFFELARQQWERWGTPEPFEGLEAYLRPRPRAETFTRLLIQQTVEPLGMALRERSGRPRVTLLGRRYTAKLPRRAIEPVFEFVAPLSIRVCEELVRDTASMNVLVLDPGRGTPLAIEQTRYARERTALIEFEANLWSLAHRYGAPSGVIPFQSRPLLLAVAWHPAAHAPPGAHTICVRCGELLFRTGRRTRGFPLCPACAKETPAQRAWPAHALCPAERGTWALACQYPDCDNVTIGPRHLRLCHEHTSSRLPPNRRLRREPPSGSEE